MDTLKENSPVQETTQENNANSNSELIESKIIPETPFIARRFADKWICTVGKYKVHEPQFETYEEVVEFVNNPSWELISLVIYSLIETFNDIRNNTK